MSHHPTGHVPGHATGVTELANEGRDDGSLHGHGMLAAATLSPGPMVAVRKRRAGRRARTLLAGLLVVGRASIYMTDRLRLQVDLKSTCPSDC